MVTVDKKAYPDRKTCLCCCKPYSVSCTRKACRRSSQKIVDTFSGKRQKSNYHLNVAAIETHPLEPTAILVNVRSCCPKHFRCFINCSLIIPRLQVFQITTKRSVSQLAAITRSRAPTKLSAPATDRVVHKIHEICDGEAIYSHLRIQASTPISSYS